MIQEKISTSELFAAYHDLSSEMVKLTALLTEKQINIIPFKDSWTVGQLMEHVTKSNTGIAKALNIDGKPSERKPDEREAELKEMFLDFSVKFKSPAFILPTKDFYIKEEAIEDLENSVQLLKQVSHHANLSESITHPAFGEITKLELLHFVKFHMQRHLRQLKKIYQALCDE